MGPRTSQGNNAHYTLIIFNKDPDRSSNKCNLSYYLAMSSLFVMSYCQDLKTQLYQAPPHGALVFVISKSPVKDSRLT
jgi:hypothetical protein